MGEDRKHKIFNKEKASLLNGVRLSFNQTLTLTITITIT